MKPVSHTTEQALRAALARLSSENPLQTDGRLTVANLAREAGVSRATANRALLILSELQDMAKARKQRVAEHPPCRVVQVERNQRAIDDLVAQHIQVRALLSRSDESRKARLARIHHLRQAD
jgi:hypothetical protein